MPSSLLAFGLGYLEQETVLQLVLLLFGLGYLEQETIFQLVILPFGLGYLEQESVFQLVLNTCWLWIFGTGNCSSVSPHIF